MFDILALEEVAPKVNLGGISLPYPFYHARQKRLGLLLTWQGGKGRRQTQAIAWLSLLPEAMFSTGLILGLSLQQFDNELKPSNRTFTTQVNDFQTLP